MRAVYFLWGLLIVGGGASLFLLKYKVQALEDQLVASQEQVARDRSAIRVLEAEWTYLNDPERLRRLSAEHLGFGQATARNMASLDTLPMRGQQPNATPPVPTIPLRARPQIEAQAAPQSLGDVLLSRLQDLFFSGTAVATTIPLPRRERRGE